MRTEIFVVPEVLSAEESTQFRAEFQEACTRLVHKQYVLYSPELGEQILALYANGATISQISRYEGMPTYQTILKWCRDETKFAREFENARMARALFLEDKVSDIALAPPCSKDDAPGMGHKLAALTKLIEWGDPARFGKKVTVAGDQARPVVFRVVTGVPENLNQRQVTLNADGTQKRDILVEPSSSVEEQPAGGSPSPLADVGSIPASAPDEPEPPEAA